MRDPANHHCCVVDISGTGVLIEGPSGSGKTSLALGLLERAEVMGRPAFLVADDQAMLQPVNGALVARVPGALAGKAEIRGFGISRRPYLENTVVRLVSKFGGRRDGGANARANDPVVSGLEASLCKRAYPSRGCCC